MSLTQLLKVARTKMSQNPLFFLELFARAYSLSWIPNKVQTILVSIKICETLLRQN